MKKKIIYRHFLIVDTCKKGTGFENWKLMDHIATLVVSLLSILVPLDWKWLFSLLSLCSLFLCFSLFFTRWQAWRSSGVTVAPVKECARHTLFSNSAKEVDWGIGLTFMVYLQKYWALFRKLCSKLVTRSSSRELQFFKINSEFSLSYFLSPWIDYSDHWVDQ